MVCKYQRWLVENVSSVAVDTTFTMNIFLPFFLISILALGPVASAQTPQLPDLPEALKELKPALASVKGVLSLSVTAAQPLTAVQWDAIESLHPRHLRFNDNALDDAGMSRLVALDPITVGINKSLLSGNGVAKFGEMKSLTGISAMHIVKPTPEAKAALSNHPTVESFATDGAFCIEVVTAPNLRSVDLKHGAADDKFVALLVRHPSLESLRLWPKGGASLTDAAFASIVTLPKLKKLTVDCSVLSYEGGLKLLKNLPNLETLDFHEVALTDEDLSKLKADLPKVKITFTPMTPEYRAQWNAWAAKKQ